MSELEDAKDKVMMGAERRSLVMSDDEKKLTAFHEAGHAIVALNVTGTDPIHKATIIPRGHALGMVMRLPERDQMSLSSQKILADVCVAFGGRVAEELVFGYDAVTTGASSAIQPAPRRVCSTRAKPILPDRRSDLNVLARVILEYETLTGDEIIALRKGIAPVRPSCA